MFRLSDIKYETRSFFVLGVGDRGFEVYEKAGTHSKRVAAIGNGPAPSLGFERAKAEADKRQTTADAQHDELAKRCPPARRIDGTIDEYLT